MLEPSLDLASVELVALRVCEEMDAAIMFPELDDGVGPAFTSVAERRLVDRPSLEVNERLLGKMKRKKLGCVTEN